MAVIREGRNRASAKEAASFVEEFDRLEQLREAKLAELDAEFKAKKRDLNKGINNDQKALLADAKKMGVKKGVIRALADPQKKRRKAQEALEAAEERAEEAILALEADDQDFAKDIREALGEDFASLPLGAAAVEREEAQPDMNAPDPIAAAAEKAWNEAEPKKGKAKN
jgi:hypothetical protein